MVMVQRLKSNPGMNKMISVQLLEDGTGMTNTNCYEQTQKPGSIFCHIQRFDE